MSKRNYDDSIEQLSGISALICKRARLGLLPIPLPVPLPVSVDNIDFTRPPPELPYFVSAIVSMSPTKPKIRHSFTESNRLSNGRSIFAQAASQDARFYHAGQTKVSRTQSLIDAKLDSQEEPILPPPINPISSTSVTKLNGSQRSHIVENGSMPSSSSGKAVVEKQVFVELSRKPKFNLLDALVSDVPEYNIVEDDIIHESFVPKTSPLEPKWVELTSSTIVRLAKKDKIHKNVILPSPSYNPGSDQSRNIRTSPPTVLPSNKSPMQKFTQSNEAVTSRPTRSYPKQKFSNTNGHGPTNLAPAGLEAKKTENGTESVRQYSDSFHQSKSVFFGTDTADTAESWRQSTGPTSALSNKGGFSSRNASSNFSQSASPSMSCCDESNNGIVSVDFAKFQETYAEAFLLDFTLDRGIPVKFIDTHAHIDHVFKMFKFKGSWKEFKIKYGTSYPRSIEGVIADFCFPSQFLDDTFYLDLQQPVNTDLYFAFGCHPHAANEWEIASYKEKIISILRSQSLRVGGRVVAVGEMGLDYSFKNKVDHDIQKRVFVDQMLLAMELNLPILLHIRDADEEGLQLLKDHLPTSARIHWHCFNRVNMHFAQAVIKHFPNLKFGLTPHVATTEAMNQVLKQIPLNRFLIETDSPYFSPEAMRKGEYKCPRGHPGMGVLVAVKLANVKGISVADVLKVIRQNTNEIYAI